MIQGAGTYTKYGCFHGLITSLPLIKLDAGPQWLSSVCKLDSMGKKNFNVIVMHGHSNDHKAVNKLVGSEGCRPVVLTEGFSRGIILEKLHKKVWEKAHRSIIIMGPNDQTENGPKGRQNVVFELGYGMAAFDRISSKYWYNAVIILKEETWKSLLISVAWGLSAAKEKLTKATLDRIGRALGTVLENASEFHDELN